jgi:hypothetical protein
VSFCGARDSGPEFARALNELGRWVADQRLDAIAVARSADGALQPRELVIVVSGELADTRALPFVDVVEEQDAHVSVAHWGVVVSARALAVVLGGDGLLMGQLDVDELGDCITGRLDVDHPRVL